MSAAFNAERIFSELDRVRIERLVTRFSAPNGLPRTLLEGFDEGDFLMPSDIPGDVVTMNSRLSVRDLDGNVRQISICYPDEADAANGFLSVLSPVGGQLLGRRVGEAVSWMDVGGTTSTLHIESLLFQPEASGELAL